MSRPGPLVISVADLLRRPGSQRTVQAAVPLDGLALSTAHVPAGGIVEVDVVIESLSEAVVLTGRVLVPWTGECRRCLRTVSATADTDVREVFESDPVDGETYPLRGEQIDLEPMVRDAVLLALPLAPVCDDDCAGPDPEQYPVRAASEATPDPRWAKLGELSFDPDS